MVFLLIQKTSGSLFGLHLLDLILPTPCLCWPRTGADLGPKSLQVRHPINPFTVSQRGHSQLVHMCTCPRRPGKDTWLFSRYTTGWKCGVHADWTMLQDCVPDFYKETYNTTDHVYKYVTVMRNPVDRYFSEFEHLHRSFGHEWDLSRSVDSCNDRFVRFFFPVFSTSWCEFNNAVFQTVSTVSFQPCWKPANIHVSRLVTGSM